MRRFGINLSFQNALNIVNFIEPFHFLDKEDYKFEDILKCLIYLFDNVVSSNFLKAIEYEKVNYKSGFLWVKFKNL